MWAERTYASNGINLNVREAGASNAPVMVMLHGFPEYSVAWAAVAEKLADTYHLVLPDQRGFGRSDAPEGVEAYDTKHMVADLLGLIDQIAPDQQIILCGHDWGASVAYAFAMRHSARVSRLIIANGVHPICFQKALYAGGEQTVASQYMTTLRTPDIEDRLAPNGFERLLGMFRKFSSAPWLNASIEDAYRKAWSGDGRLTAMLNWYRASPMIVPAEDAEPRELNITDEMRARYRIAMPHLLIWGLDDQALLIEARADLGEFCDDLTVTELKGASHWLLHEKPEEIAALIRDFVD
ncbi:alpha/beta fold family hydrolase [Ahrensia sp. R2A130]|nr:alpha/beta fold family hydrolase [Ahrensia sp. R2A130]